MSALTLFPKRIHEPKKMERLEMEAFDTLSKANALRWSKPILDFFEAETRITKGKVLDVACGPGLLSKAFAEWNRGLVIVGVDISPAALSLARKNSKRLENTSFVKGSVYALPFNDNTFDAVICKDSFHHFDNPRKALTEMLRVVKQDGYVYIQDMRRDLPRYLIDRSIGRKNVVEKLQYYSTRAAYTKQEMRNLLRGMKIKPIRLTTPMVTPMMKKTYPRFGIRMDKLRAGLQARYNLLIRKSRAYGASPIL